MLSDSPKAFAYKLFPFQTSDPSASPLVRRYHILCDSLLPFGYSREGVSLSEPPPNP